MSIELSTASAAAAPASSSIAAAAGSPSELFTKLLVAQIRNQDPLEPSDPGEFVNQLTQLSQMESLQTLASQNTANAGAMQGLQALTLGAQVGSQVSVSTDTVVLDREKVQASVELADPVAAATLVLTGADGREKRVALGALPAGEAGFSIDPEEFGLLPGTYRMRMETGGAAPAIQVSGTLTSVRLTASGPLLDVSHVGQVSSTSITRFNGKQAG